MCFNGVVNCILKMAERLRFTMRNCSHVSDGSSQTIYKKSNNMRCFFWNTSSLPIFSPVNDTVSEWTLSIQRFVPHKNLITTHVFNMANLCVVVNLLNMKKDKPSTGMVQSWIKHSWMPTELLCPECYRKHSATIPHVHWELAFLTAFVIPMYIQYKYCMVCFCIVKLTQSVLQGTCYWKQEL